MKKLRFKYHRGIFRSFFRLDFCADDELWSDVQNPGVPPVGIDPEYSEIKLPGIGYIRYFTDETNFFSSGPTLMISARDRSVRKVTRRELNVIKELVLRYNRTFYRNSFKDSEVWVKDRRLKTRYWDADNYYTFDRRWLNILYRILAYPVL